MSFNKLHISLQKHSTTDITAAQENFDNNFQEPATEKINFGEFLNFYFESVESRLKKRHLFGK